MGERDPQKQLWSYQVNLDKRVRSERELILSGDMTSVRVSGSKHPFSPIRPDRKSLESELSSRSRTSSQRENSILRCPQLLVMLFAGFFSLFNRFEKT